MNLLSFKKKQDVKITGYLIFLMLLLFSCSLNNSDNQGNRVVLEFGGDFSIMKKMEDAGGLYKIDGVVKEGFKIFNDNGYTWARLRIFHTPEMDGSVCNDLDYTIKLAQKAKKFGFKILLNFHYSDTWADPGHQIIPAAWRNLSFELVQDSLYNYTKSVIDAMDNAGVLPDMVQIGNEINNGMMWPHGKLWVDANITNWDNLSELLQTGIRGVKEAKNGAGISIMIHAANGGDVNSSYKFYKNIIDRGVDFDVIGLSYYPWWHGTFIELEANILYLSKKFYKDFSIVETAYYSNDWYPEPTPWIYSDPPFPPTEQGQYDYLFTLAQIIKQHPRVKTIFYWKPDALDIPKTKVNYLDRSLFDKDGNAYSGISALKDALKN
ncbi:MAG: arabinogalactan endo-1,4-beta-galactosidase [Draconibacterium sp.]|nr:arabinogalactan endo-1,4-beta-galactosidase [Draconibacterium sp.]